MIRIFQPTFGKTLLCIIVLALLNLGQIWSEEESPEADPFIPQIETNQRDLGDQSFAISAGLFIPLFTVLLADWPSGPEAGAHETHLNAGGTGSLTYSVYLNSNWKIGLQIAGSFSEDINKNFAFIIPITIKANYEFHLWNRFTLPIFLQYGISMTSWQDDNFSVDMILRSGFGFYFDWSYEWSFGMDISYWLIPQINSQNDWERSLGNFMDISLAVEYHF